MELDELDRLAATAFDGYLVRKDLAQRFKGQYPVPTYVGEFLLGRYCASTDEEEIAEGLEVVERQMRERTVRPGEEELFKSRAREHGSIKLIDLITARLDTTTDSYLASLPSLRLNDVRIDSEIVNTNERMLTGGFYAEIQIEYDAAIAQEKAGRPFGLTSLRPIQLSKRGVLDDLARGREYFTTTEWKHFLLRSIGFEPERLSTRAQDVLLLRMVPFVERNYNMVELGPRGTGKSHLFQQISPYSHLVSGGKATVARMFVNNANGQRGLVCQYGPIDEGCAAHLRELLCHLVRAFLARAQADQRTAANGRRTCRCSHGLSGTSPKSRSPGDRDGVRHVERAAGRTRAVGGVGVSIVDLIDAARTVEERIAQRRGLCRDRGIAALRRGDHSATGALHEQSLQRPGSASQTVAVIHGEDEGVALKDDAECVRQLARAGELHGVGREARDARAPEHRAAGHGGVVAAVAAESLLKHGQNWSVPSPKQKALTDGASA